MKNREFLDKIQYIPTISKQNLGVLLQKTDNTLDYWIKRLRSEKVLIPIKKGLYISRYYYDIIKAGNQSDQEIYMMYLANTIRQPSYVSGEYVLAKQGFLPEAPFSMTSITLKSTRSYTTEIGTFYYKNIKQALFSGYTLVPFRDKHVKEATFAKALFDFLYLRPFKNTTEMCTYILSTGRFNWDVLQAAHQTEFVEIVQASGSKKMQSVVSMLQKEGVL